MAQPDRVYRISFIHRSKVIEIYARSISQDAFYAFVEVSDILFGERTKLVLDPSEEQIKAMFAGVIRTYLPINSIVRIDEVDKPGIAKMLPAEEAASGKNITPLPTMAKPRTQ